MSLASRVLRTIRKHEMLPAGGRVLVAVSGGPDSVALLHVLRILETRRALTVAAVAHFNHQLRGAEADGDERFCRDLAATLGIPFEAGAGDVRALARASGRSVEDAARAARYAFLHEAAARVGADAIAVGHTRDDQAETFLLRLLRGAGARGLAGIRPRNGLVVRPLLDVSRAELRAYAAEHGLAFRIDASNADTAIPRNRVRLDLIPRLEGYSPSIVPTLAREAELARADAEYLDSVAIDLARSIVLQEEHGIVLDADALRGLPQALASRVARNALNTAAPGRFIGFQHIDDLLDLSRAADGASVAMPGLMASRCGRTIRLGTVAGVPFSNSFRFPLSIPGEVALPGWTVSAERLERLTGDVLPPAKGGTAVLPASLLRYPLAVRNRRRGDRFQPLGMGGRGRKLQDFLVDRKVGLLERDRLPLVVDRDDRIVWVAGQSVAEDFRITSPEQGVIVLKVRRLGGVG